MNFINETNTYFEKHRERILAEWFELLAIRSIGVDPLCTADCARCAAWLKRFLKKLGFEVLIKAPEGGTPPVVFAEKSGSSSAPEVLFYGHYDVQPPDPLDEWHTPPFEPTLLDGRVYARGAQDNKGQLFAFLQGVACLLHNNVPLPTMRIVLEGQEESGSSALMAHAHEWRKMLQGNVLLVSDTDVHPSGRPAIIVGLRGVQSLTVTLTGPSYDLHSGMHGGLAPNPALGMARLLATLHDQNGRIAVAGFADHVEPPSARELELLREVPFDVGGYKQEIGVLPAGGEQGIPPDERVAFMPTIEVNGIHSGYGGAGSKTVIPATALAKLSMRLCPGQSPAATMQAVEEHLRANCPRGLKLTLSNINVSAPGFRLPLNSPIFQLATDVLTTMDSRGPVYRWSGASIPVISTLRHVSGAAPLLVGFGREEDRIHCANESFSLQQFQQVMSYATGILRELAG